MNCTQIKIQTANLDYLRIRLTDTSTQSKSRELGAAAVVEQCATSPAHRATNKRLLSAPRTPHHAGLAASRQTDRPFYVSLAVRRASDGPSFCHDGPVCPSRWSGQKTRGGEGKAGEGLGRGAGSGGGVISR